jgi:hypothetical protein
MNTANKMACLLRQENIWGGLPFAVRAKGGLVLSDQSKKPRTPAFLARLKSIRLGFPIVLLAMSLISSNLSFERIGDF